MNAKALRGLGAPLAAALLIAIGACSGGTQHGALVPDAGGNAAAPFAMAAPPVTAPVTIPYPYTSKYTTQTWTGPTANPVVSSGRDDGVTTVKFALDKKTGIYDVLETIASKLGYKEVLNSAISFPKFEGGTAQIILSDNYSYVQGGLTQTGLDTYPQTQDSINFPLTPGRRWSAAAMHLSSYGIVLGGKGGFAENSSTNEAADGGYTSQVSFSSTHGAANQDNYASTTDVRLGGPSTYRLSEPAAGYNTLTQTFALPANGKIAVTSSGKPPIPFKAGTVRVKTWYPRGGGSLPRPLYADNWRVAGSATMPAQCGKRQGQASTKVVETSWNIDPVQGFDDSYTALYYLTSLAKGQYWFACIVENYTNENWANGWVMSSGNWGGPYSKTVGTEVLLATGAKPSADALRTVSAMHVLEFVPPALEHVRLARLGIRKLP